MNNITITQNASQFAMNKVEPKITVMDCWIHILCFVSILLIGADRWGLNVGVNLRLDQVFLCIFTLLLVFRNRFWLTWNSWIVLFILSGFISALGAVSLKRGALFYCSIIYNVIFLFYAFESYVRAYGIKKLISIFRKTLYTQFCIMLLQVALKLGAGIELSILPSYGEYLGVPRFSLWFYEPSYLTTYLSFWFAMSLYMLLIGKDRSYGKDILMALIMFLLATSTTGFLAIILSCGVVYLLWICKGITLKKLIFPCIVVIAFLVFRFGFSSIYEVFFARLFNQSLDSASGGRISLWAETWKVFIENPLFGVGPGNYGLYLGQEAGRVPSNVTLELLATLGIFATIAFYGLTLALCIQAVLLNRKKRNKESRLLVACAVALLIFSIVLQANQGYLRLYHWLFIGMLSGGIRQGKRGLNRYVKENLI